MLEIEDPFGWHKIDEPTLHKIRERLQNFETMTWGEILLQGRKNHHFIRTSDLCPEARNRLEELKQDDIDRIVSLRLSSLERIYGILEDGILRLLWWDPEHRVCPSIKKHT